MARIPRVLIIGNEALTSNHGTGMMFARHFSNYPKSKIIDVHFQTEGEDYLFPKILVNSRLLDRTSWGDPCLWELNHYLAGRGEPRRTNLIFRNRVFGPVKIPWEKFGGPPDVIYSTCFNAENFAFLHHVYRSLPKRIPIIQHFLDLDTRDSRNLQTLFRELLPAMVEIWALTKSAQDWVSKFSALKPTIVQAIQQPLSNSFKNTHGNLSRNFSSVLIGNIWSASAYRALYSIWAQCQRDLKILPSVTWFGHARRLSILQNRGIYVGTQDPVVRDSGLAPRLNPLLRNADLGIIAFTGKEIDYDQYAKFSLPSRIGDYCANGLPVVIIGRRGTEPFRLVEENGLGINIDPSNEKIAVRKLERFILDRKHREECGMNARRFMKRYHDLELYQRSLYSRLSEIAKIEVPSFKTTLSPEVGPRPSFRPGLKANPGALSGR